MTNFSKVYVLGVQNNNSSNYHFSQSLVFQLAPIIESETSTLTAKHGAPFVVYDNIKYHHAVCIKYIYI